MKTLPDFRSLPKIPVLLITAWGTLAAPAEPAHPVLSIPNVSNSAATANNILGAWTESYYTQHFIPRQSPRDDYSGMVPAVVAGDTSWSWSDTAPDVITSKPSNKVFPGAAGYTLFYQSVAVLDGTSVQVPYYLKAGGGTEKSLVQAQIDFEKRQNLRNDLNALADAYMDSGSSHATRNQAYARRIAAALLEWAKWYPKYYMTEKTGPASFINGSPSFVANRNLQRAAGFNGFGDEWNDGDVLVFDAIYDSPALAALSAEVGYDARAFIRNNLLGNEADFFIDHVPPDVAIGGNLSSPYRTLAKAARVLGKPETIPWLDDYLSQTVNDKLRRDGMLSESLGYAEGYLSSNIGVSQDTDNYFLSRPADTAELLAAKGRIAGYKAVLESGKSNLGEIALPDGELPSFGDTTFRTPYPVRASGNSALLPAYGSLSLGAGTGGQAVQLNQNFSGDNNHMRSDLTALSLWAFGDELLGNCRYHHSTAGRNFTEQILAHNAVTIDRTDMTSRSANTDGNGDLTLYEPGNGGLAVTEIDARRTYSNKASRYQRIVLLNSSDLSKPYLVDVFRVTGGKTHDYVLHGSIRYDQTWECSFPLAADPAPYPMLENGETWTEPTDVWSVFPYYGFWRNVSRNPAPGDFQITYRDSSSANRDLRLWMTDDGTAEVNIGRTPVPERADHQPATFFSKGYWRPSAIIRKRISSGTLDDLFVSVIEPLNKGASGISSVERLPVAGGNLDSCALKIGFVNGRVDTYFVNLRNPRVDGANTGSATVSTADGSMTLTGRIGAISRGPGGSQVWTMAAADFQYPGGRLTSPDRYWSGTIAGETRKATGAADNAFFTTTPLPTGTALRGQQLSVTYPGSSAVAEMFIIDQVLLKNGQYHVVFTADHQLEITGNTLKEQLAPKRTFTGTATFEITRSASTVPVSTPDEANVAVNGSSGPISIGLRDLGDTPAAALQVSVASSDQVLAPGANLSISGTGASRTLTISPAAGLSGSALVTFSVTNGNWIEDHVFKVTVGDPPPVTAGSMAGLPDDVSLFENGGSELSNATSLLGAGGSSPWVDRCTIYAFTLPDFGGIANPFVEAALNFNYVTKQNALRDNDLYGLGSRSSPVVLPTDYYGKTADLDPTDATLIQAAALTDSTPYGEVTSSGTGLVNYLNAEYAAGSGAGRTVFLRLNSAGEKTGIRRATLSMAEDAVPGNRPRVDFLVSALSRVERWRQLYFGSHADAGDAADLADADGDGLTNAEEYVLGTLPKVADAGTPLTMTMNGSNIDLSFPATPALGTGYDGLNRMMELQSTDDLSDPGSWVGVPGFMNISASGQTVTGSLPTSDARKFYRLRIWLIP